MPFLDITLVTAEPYYQAFVPTIKFKIQLSDRSQSPERIIGGLLNVGVSLLKNRTGYETAWLGQFALQIPASHERPLGQQHTVEQFLALSIDINNSMFDFIKTIEGDDITFVLHIGGLVFWKLTDNDVAYLTHQPFGTSDEVISRETSLSVEKWKKLISTYYRDLTWVGISRNTYSKMNKVLNEKGITADELISAALKERV